MKSAQQVFKYHITYLNLPKNGDIIKKHGSRGTGLGDSPLAMSSNGVGVGIFWVSTDVLLLRTYHAEQDASNYNQKFARLNGSWLRVSCMLCCT